MKLIKLSADDGQKYLKVLMQIVYNVSPDPDSYCSDMSPERTFLVALLPGVKENYMTVREIFDAIDWSEFFLMCSNHSLRVWVPADNKMENLLLGIGPHSSTFPSSRCLWSKNVSKSKPEEDRTVMGVKEKAAERKEKAAALCNSVEHEPVKFLVQHPEDVVRDMIFSRLPSYTI